MLIKEKILLNGQDINLKISLSSNGDLSGYQDDIDSFVTEETTSSINEVSDEEKIRFVNSNSNGTRFDWNFQPTPSLGLENVGFSTGDTFSINYLRSFFMLYVYDSNDSRKQTLLHKSFFNGIDFSGTSADYQLTPEYEFMDFYFSESFLETYTGQTLYAKTYFYNAKNGRVYPFYNFDLDTGTTEAKLYFPLTLNKTNRTYTLADLTANEINNSEYTNKLNNNVESFNNEKPTYPTGSIFSGGTYILTTDDGQIAPNPFASVRFVNQTPFNVVNIYAGDLFTFDVVVDTTNFEPINFRIGLYASNFEPIYGYSGGTGFDDIDARTIEIPTPNPLIIFDGALANIGSVLSFSGRFVNESVISPQTFDLEFKILTDQENDGTYIETSSITYDTIQP